MSQYLSGGNLISKIGSYLQIVTKDPRSTAFVPLAEAYRQIGLLDDALEAARLGTSSLPHFSPGFSTLGRVLGQMGRIEEAMGSFAKALSIDRQSQAALVGLARLHLIKGERDQARKILKEAEEFHPQDANVRNMLIALDLPRPWDKIKDVQTELVAPERAQSVEPEPSHEPASIFTATLAEIYIKQGLTEKAVDVYRQILRQDPENLAVRERLVNLLGDEPSGDSAPDVPAAGNARVETLALESRLAGQDDNIPVEPEQSSEVPETSLLATFERWLTGIQRRREHVH